MSTNLYKKFILINNDNYLTIRLPFELWLHEPLLSLRIITWFQQWCTWIFFCRSSQTISRIYMFYRLVLKFYNFYINIVISKIIKRINQWRTDFRWDFVEPVPKISWRRMNFHEIEIYRHMFVHIFVETWYGTQQNLTNLASFSRFPIKLRKFWCMPSW